MDTLKNPNELWDGDESTLPPSLQFLLDNMDVEGAKIFRDELAKLTPEQIGAFTTIALTASGPDNPDALAPEDVWDHAKIEIGHIAEMFRTLSDAGMPDEMAMTVINDRIAPHGYHGGLNTAGTRVESIYSQRDVQLGSHFGSTIVPPFGK